MTSQRTLHARSLTCRNDEGAGDAPGKRAAGTAPPGPKGAPLVGVALQLRGDPLKLITSVVTEYGDVVQLPLLNIPLTPMEPKRRVYLVSRPDLVKHICVTHKKKYRTHQQLVDKLAQTLDLRAGELLTSVGDEWAARKTLLQPSFNEKAVAGLTDNIVGCTSAMVARWRQRPDGGVVDLVYETTRFVTELFALLFAGVELSGRHAHLGECWEHMLDGWTRRMSSPLPLLHRLPTRKNRRFRAALLSVETALREIIRSRRDSGKGQGDLLSAWMHAPCAKDASAMNDKSLLDQLMLLLLAGRRNVANALAWSFHLLALHPAQAQRLHREIESNLGERPLNAASLQALPYAGLIQKETLRLYPTAWLIARTCLEDDTVGGYTIARGATVFMSPYTIHRDPRYWSDPERFHPERFADTKRIDAEAYLPFGKGPRTCIGNFMTEYIMQIALVMLSRKFVFAPQPGHKVRIKATSSLHPDGFLPIVLHHRN
jgi:cytochrome P450